MTSDLAGWLEHIEQLHPREIELGLERVHSVAGRMGVQPVAQRVVTVAGTNGKGSCVAWLEAILSTAGYRVGAYTSPHLLRYNERIRIEKQDCPDADIVRAFERVEAARGDTGLTYFEFGTLAALDLFRRSAVEIAILEVGLGGRLDAVNIVDADVAVITSVGLDHQQWLGQDRDAIGAEKAGVFRSAKPAIVADPPDSVIKAAQRTGARLQILGQDFHVHTTRDGYWDWASPVTHWQDLPVPAFGGVEQLHNAACALAAVDHLSVQFPVQRAHITAALEQLRLAGRCQPRALAGHQWIFDVAHNREAALTLAQCLDRQGGHGRTLALVGFLGDKPVEAIAGVLDAGVDQWWAVASESQRALDAQAVARRLQTAVDAPVCAAGNVGSGVEALLAVADPTDRLLVTGSFTVVGAAIEYLTHREAATG